MKYVYFLSIISILNFGFSTLMAENKPKVLLASTIDQDSKNTRLFIKSLKNINCQDISIDYLFIDNSNNLSNYINKLFNSSVVYKNVYKSIAKDTYSSSEQAIWQRAYCKNKMIEKALADNYDYLLIVDSNVMLSYETIEQLIKDKKDIISPIVWDSQDQNYPQVWLHDQEKKYAITGSAALDENEITKRKNGFTEELKKPGTYQVGGLAGCILISRKALQAGVNFNEIKNITFLPEECHFSIRAQVLGFSLFVDTNFPAYYSSSNQ